MLNTQVITCPSGLIVEIREITFRDEKLFTNRDLIRKGALISTLIEKCVTQIVDYGPYDSAEFTWKKACSSDRMYAFLNIRAVSYGDDYEFKVVCSNSFCSQRIYYWGIKISELPCAEVSKEGKKFLSTGIPLEFKLGDGSLVHFRMLSADDEQRISQLNDKDPDNIISNALKLRIVDLDGETISTNIIDKLDSLPARYMDQLQEYIDYVEGGVTTDINVECKVCGNLQRVVLPFDTNFFSSRKPSSR